MSNCDLKIIIGKSALKIEGAFSDTDNITLSKIIDKLDDNTLEEIAKAYKERDSDKVSKISLSEIETDKLLPNTSFKELKSWLTHKYSSMSWEEFEEDDLQLLVVENLSLNGTDVTNKIVQTYGTKFLAINPKNYEQVKNFNDYLKLKHILTNNTIGGITLPFSIQQLGFKTTKALLLDYLENKSKYYGLKVTINGKEKSAHVEIIKVLNELLEKGKTKYNTPLGNDLANLMTKSSYNSFHIPIIDFVQTEYGTDLVPDSEVVVEKSDTITDSSELESKKAKSIGIKAYNEKLAQVAPDFPFRVKEKTKQHIIFEPIRTNISERYSIGYDTITKFQSVKEYKGYTIYQDLKGKYYISKDPISLQSSGVQYSTLAEAINGVDKELKYQPIYKYSYLGIKNIIDGYALLPNKFPVGYVIRSLRVDDVISTHVFNIKNETIKGFLFSEGTNKTNTLEFVTKGVIKTFFNNDSNIEEIMKRELDNGEKLSAFLVALDYILSNTPTNNPNDLFNQALSLIKVETIAEIDGEPATSKFVYDSYMIKGQTAEKYSYYTQLNDDRNTINKTMFKTYLLPIKELDIKEYTDVDESTQRPKLIFEELKNLCDIISQKTNVPIITLTQSEIESSKELKELNLNAHIKTFYHNGAIYVNLTKASTIHVWQELSHLAILALQATEPETYNLLIEALSKHNTFNKRVFGKSQDPRFKDVSPEIIHNEVFIDLFSNYLMGDKTEMTEFFDLAKEKSTHSLQELLLGINTESDRNIKLPLSSILSNFRNNYLRNQSEAEQKLDFFALPSNDEIETHLIVRDIVQQINKGEITEECQ